MKRKKIIYSLSIMGILAVPVVTIMSCGKNNDSEEQEKDQKKLNNITSEQITSLLGMKGVPTKMASTVGYPQNKNNISINKLSGVNIYVSGDDWNKDDEKGEIVFSVIAKKSGLTDHVVRVVADGYNNDQGKLNAITEDQIKKAFKDAGTPLEGDPSKLPSTITLTETSKKDLTVNGLDHVNITLTNISDSNVLGKMNFTAIISTRDGNLKPHNVNGTIEGYKSESDADAQIRQQHVDLQAISGGEILEKMNFKADSTKQVDNTTITVPNPEYTDKNFDKVLKVKITTTNWETNDWWTGDASFDAELSVPSDSTGYGTTTVRGIQVSGYMVKLTKTNMHNGSLAVTTTNAVGEKTYTVQHSVTIIGIFLTDFGGAKFMEFEANSRLKTIEHDALKGGFRGDFVLPDSLERIGHNAFQSNDFDLITMGNNLQIIDYNAFRDARLSGINSLIIPSSVITIGYEAFNAITNLSSLTFNGELPGSTGSTRKLTVENGAFYTTPISAIYGQKWQEWATDNYRNAFKA